LTKRKFLWVCNSVWTPFGFPHISGHCVWIGGTTELLLHGAAPYLVQLLGRRKFDAFFKALLATH
ncbi:hypothetical protein BDN67DRAFT_901012, partial [Paxillus ammoniavirescens]